MLFYYLAHFKNPLSMDCYVGISARLQSLSLNYYVSISCTFSGALFEFSLNGLLGWYLTYVLFDWIVTLGSGALFEFS